MLPAEPAPPGALRARLAGPEPLLVPGCVDALSARVAVDVGFEAVYATGAGISNTLLGMPDVGLATMTEISEQVRRICDAVDVPVIADMDTGYGNAVNAARAVRVFERAGAAAVQIEDQVFPKKCGHFDRKVIVPVAEMRGKLRAVLDSRLDPQTVVIARTDALAAEGAEAAVERANVYAELGADLVFVEAPTSRELLAELPSRVRAPLVANMVEGGRTPMCDLTELGEMGYRVVLYANAALRASVRAMHQALATLRADGDSRRLLDAMISWQERQRLVGKDEIDRVEHAYAPQ